MATSPSSAYGLVINTKRASSLGYEFVYNSGDAELLRIERGNLPETRIRLQSDMVWRQVPAHFVLVGFFVDAIAVTTPDVIPSAIQELVRTPISK